MSLLSSFRALFAHKSTTLAPPPEPCRFVKGLAKSLREDPEKAWTESGNICGSTWFDAALRHRDLECVIWMRWRWDREQATNMSLPGCTWLKAIYLTYPVKPHELVLIAQALEARPRRAFKKHIEDCQAREALLRRTNDYFSKLGCPHA